MIDVLTAGPERRVFVVFRIGSLVAVHRRQPDPTPAPASATAGDACFAPRGLLVADAMGGHPSVVAEVPHAKLLWSPDGSVLAFRPYWHDEMGRPHTDAWRLVEPGQPPTIRTDLSPELDGWIGPNELLVAQALPSDPDSDAPHVARLLLVDLNGHWREIAPRAEVWATAPTVGVLGE